MNSSNSPSRSLLGISLTVALIGGAFAVGLVPRLRSREAVSQATRELATPTVSVVSPRMLAAGAPLQIPAEIRAETEAVVASRATGYVRRWLVELGASVTNGQLLAELETPDTDAELVRARSQLRESEATEALSRTTADRWKEMFRVAAVSRQEMDEKVADLQLRSAQVESARANVRRLEELAGFSRIVAPFDGVVTARRLDVGQLVNASAGTELYRIADPRRLRVLVRVPQTLASQVQRGQKAELSLPEHPGRIFTAEVERTARALEPQSRTLLTELLLPNPDGGLFPGGYAQARFPAVRRDPVLAIPANTLLLRPDGPTVAVVGEGGRVSLRTVSLGRDHGPMVEVPVGLATNLQLVLNPSDALPDGTVVRVAAPSQPRP